MKNLLMSLVTAANTIRPLSIRSLGCRLVLPALALSAALTARAVPVKAEVEPNNAYFNATSLNVSSGYAIASGAISVAGDQDYFKFTAPAGARVWILVDTGGPKNSGATTSDSIVTLLTGDGATLLEEDDDDGTESGLSPAATSRASAIAGHVLTTGGTYLIRVRAYEAAGIINPYKLYVAVTTAAESEVEGNSQPALANPIVTALNPIGVRTGTAGLSGDVDYYTVDVLDDTYLFVSLDCDAGRAPSDFKIELFNSQDDAIYDLPPLVTADASGSAANAAESFAYHVTSQGYRYLKVTHVGSGYGYYRLMAAVIHPMPLNFSTGMAIRTGSLVPGSMFDLHRFSVPVNSKAWIYVDTGGAANPGSQSRDSVVELLDANLGSIEYDDNDGTGNGGNASVESHESSAIGGRSLAPGTYFARVSEFFNPGDVDFPMTIDPYKIFVVLTTSTPTAEHEPANNSLLTADAIVTANQNVGVFSGNNSSAADVDIYSVVTEANATLYVNLDEDPERNGSDPDLAVELLSPAGAVLLTADAASTDGLPAEAFSYNTTVAGTYFVKVRRSTRAGATGGTYQLMVAKQVPIIYSLTIVGADAVLTFPTTLGQNLKVQGSTNLKQWAALSGVIAGTDNDVEYTDAGAAARPKRFYRLVTVP